MSSPSGRGRHEDNMAAGKRYNSRSPAPVDTRVARASSTTRSQHSRSPSVHSASNSPRLTSSTHSAHHHHHHRHSSSSSGVHSGRKGYNETASSPRTPDSGQLPPSRSSSRHLSPIVRDERSLSRGRSSSDASHRSGSLTGRKGYNAEEPAARHSRSSSAASGPSASAAAASRATTDAGPDFSPRTHIGMSGRKGYNQENPVAVAEAQESLGLGLSNERSPQRHEGATGRKGYNKAPSPGR